MWVSGVNTGKSGGIVIVHRFLRQLIFHEDSRNRGLIVVSMVVKSGDVIGANAMPYYMGNDTNDYEKLTIFTL